jgi:hypothetical protein
MTGESHDPTVRRALNRIATPDHDPTFWTELERHLDERPDPLPGTRRRSLADRLGGRLLPAHPRSASLVAAAFAIILVVVAVTLTVRQDDTVDVGTVDIPSDTYGPSATTEAAASGAKKRAQAMALDWIERLASGDLAGAWELLGPAARAGWRGFEDFSAARTSFAEGFALWASAENRQVGTVELATNTDRPTYVVTITGTRTIEGTNEDGAASLVVVDGDDGGLVVEPFAPTSAGITFTHNSSDDRSPTIGSNEPLEVTAPVAGQLWLAIDRDDEVAEVALDADRTASYVPSDGWTRGRHVLTAVVMSEGVPITATTLFDVG